MRWAKPLDELLDQLPVAIPSDAGHVIVRDIVEDSRQVVEGCLFVARRGDRFDGRSLIQEAESAGAVAILSDEEGCTRATVPSIACHDPAALSVTIADRLFQSPASSIQAIAITGTNGKTTTATFLQHLLGPGTGLISSIEIDDTQARTPSLLTTPGPLELRRILARMAANGCQRVVMEASSHGIVLDRLTGLEIEGAIFTNLSGDHLDFHRTMARYAAAKRGLFAGLPRHGFAVVNLDDPVGKEMASACAARILGCRMHSSGTAHVTVSGNDAGDLQLVGPHGMLETRLNMPGEHNAMNLAQAFAAASACGLAPGVLAERILSLPTPRGRLEPVMPTGRGARVFVDFAHTDQALERSLHALRPLVPTGGRLVVVFGCGGDRDQGKRPRMGAVANRLADGVHVTSDNPRTEAPGSIIDDILSGIPDQASILVEPDRARAIEMAIGQAQPDDVILIAGKGHECAQLIGTESIPFDDRLIAREAITARWGALPA